MDEKKRIEDLRVMIVGLGLMGGSFALALKGICKLIIGVDDDPKVIESAIKLSLIDEAILSSDVESWKHFAPDLVVLAIPIRSIMESMHDLADSINNPFIVLDLGSTKDQIIKKMGTLPEHVIPIGGHPMCGKEMNSIFYADKDLYKNCTFALVQSKKSSESGNIIIEKIVKNIGAIPLWIESEDHDQQVAITSHVPHIVSSILSQYLPETYLPMTGSGFDSSTRLAQSSVDMLMDMIITNSENIQEGLEDVENKIHEMICLIKEKRIPDIRQVLNEGYRARLTFVEHREARFRNETNN